MDDIDKVVIYGVGKMAEFIFYSFQNDSHFKVVAFCADDEFLTPETTHLFGCPILSFAAILRNYSPNECLLHIAIGRNEAREKIYNKAKTAGYGFANYICSKANTWPDLVIGDNVFIDQASVVQPFVTIGNNCMLIGARIGHHSTIQHHSLLSGTSLAGNVTVGRNSFLGLNSSIKEGVVIGPYNTISAGVFVTKNTGSNVLMYISRSAVLSTRSERVVLFPGAIVNDE